MDPTRAAYPTPLTSPVAPGFPPGLLKAGDDQQLSLPEQLNALSYVRGEPGLRALLQALLTRMDMKALVSRLEGHHRDLQLVWMEVQSLSERFTTGDTSLASLENRR